MDNNKKNLSKHYRWKQRVLFPAVFFYAVEKVYFSILLTVMQTLGLTLARSEQKQVRFLFLRFYQGFQDEYSLLFLFQLYYCSFYIIHFTNKTLILLYKSSLPHSFPFTSLWLESFSGLPNSSFWAPILNDTFDEIAYVVYTLYFLKSTEQCFAWETKCSSIIISDLWTL